MTITETLKQLRDDLKIWVTNNLRALDEKIEQNTVLIDNALDENSTNPVQNKAIVEELNKLSEKIGEGGGSFSGDYSDIPNAPDIIDDESGNLSVIDSFGNLILDVDHQGVHATNVTINGEKAATETYVNDTLANITESVLKLDNFYNKTETDKVVNDKVESVKTELSNGIDSDSDEFLLIDKEGNVIATFDANGISTTALTANSAVVNGTNLISEIENINNNTTDLTSRVKTLENNYTTEIWTFTFEDGSVVDKKVVLS